MLRLFLQPFILLMFFLNAHSQVDLYRINPSKPSIPVKVPSSQTLTLGKLNLITFSMYFPSCPPCVKEINLINERLKILDLDTLITYTVITSANKKEPSIISLFSSSYLEDNKWNFPVYIDTNFALASKMGLQSFPISYLIEADGKAQYVSDPSEDIDLRIMKLFDKIVQIPKIPPVINIKQNPLSIQDVEHLAYSSKSYFEKTMKWNGFDKVSGFYKKIINGEVVMFEHGSYDSYSNYLDIYLTDLKMMKQYLQGFEKEKYKQEIGFSVYDSVTNFKHYRRKIFYLNTYDSKTGSGNPLYNIHIQSPNLESIKPFDENARVKSISYLTLDELEMLTGGLDSKPRDLYLLSKGFIPHDYRNNIYVITTNGIDGYEVEISDGVTYSVKDKSIFEQLKVDLIKSGYQLQQNKKVFKNESDHFEYTNGKFRAVFFKSEYDGDYILILKKV